MIKTVINDNLYQSDIALTNLELIDYARTFGNVITNSKGETIQYLKPKKVGSGLKGTFSHDYGLNKFPYHTDTAFWHTPARYVLFHSRKKSKTSTCIIRLDDIFQYLDSSDLKLFEKSIYKVKTTKESFYTHLKIKTDDGIGIRYDPSCMTPFNVASKKIDPILNQIINSIEPQEIEWFENKTVVINNLTNLHARSSIVNDLDRELLRIYIE